MPPLPMMVRGVLCRWSLDRCASSSAVFGVYLPFTVVPFAGLSSSSEQSSSCVCVTVDGIWVANVFAFCIWKRPRNPCYVWFPIGPIKRTPINNIPECTSQFGIRTCTFSGPISLYDSFIKLRRRRSRTYLVRVVLQFVLNRLDR